MRYLFYIFLIFAFHCRALLPARIKITPLTDNITNIQNEIQNETSKPGGRDRLDIIKLEALNHDLNRLTKAKELFERVDSIYTNIYNDVACKTYNNAREQNMPEINFQDSTFNQIKEHVILQVEELKSHILNGHYHAFAVGFSFFVRNYGEFSGVNSEQEIRKTTKELLKHIMKEEFYFSVKKNTSGSSCMSASIGYRYGRTENSAKETSGQIRAINSFWGLINLNGLYRDHDNKLVYLQFPYTLFQKVN